VASRAAAHLGSAGRRAVDRGDVHAAANLLRRATTLLPEDSLERLELLLPYAYAVGEAGSLLEAWALYDQLYHRTTTPRARRLSPRARVSRLPANDPAVDARAAVADLLETFAELGDETGLAQGYRLLGATCRVRGRIAEATAWLERALSHAESSGDVVTRRVVTQALSMAHCWGRARGGAATRRCEELRAANRDDRVLDAVIARHLSWLYAMAGRFDDARESWEWASHVLDEANMVVSSWVSQMHAAGAKELAGDIAGAERDLKSMWRDCRDALGEAPDLRAMHAAYRLANLYCDQGRWAEAEECLAFHGGHPVPEDATVAVHRPAATARLAAHDGELREAEAFAARALEV